MVTNIAKVFIVVEYDQISFNGFKRSAKRDDEHF